MLAGLRPDDPGLLAVQGQRIRTCHPFWNTDFGTPAPNIHRLTQLNFLVTYESGRLSLIKNHLDEKTPCLVFVQTDVLPYWNEDVAHAVVAIGMDETTIFVNDPAFKNAPQAIPIDYFLLAWSEFDYRYAVIQPA